MIRLARPCLIVLLLLLCAGPAAAASKTPRFYPLGVGEGPAVSDGQRDVAFPLHAPSIAFYDFGAGSPVGRLVHAPMCKDITGGPSRPAFFAVPGPGRVAWRCATPSPYLQIENLATGALSPLAEYGFFSSTTTVTAQALGTWWAAISITGYHFATLGYYNVVAGTWQDEPKSPRQYANLDAPGFAETMCSPLKRTLAPSDPRDSAALYDPYFYEVPYGVAVENSDSDTIGDITVQRCGSQRLTVVSRCPLSCTQVAYSGGLLTWVDNRALRAYVPRTGKRYSWSLSSFRPGLSNARLGETSFVHTRQRLIASVSPPKGGKEWQIFAARVPPH